MVDTILRRADVERVTGLRTSSLYEKIGAGEFPKPVRINARSVGWPASEVQAWIAARIAERDAAPTRPKRQRAAAGAA